MLYTSAEQNHIVKKTKYIVNFNSKLKMYNIKKTQKKTTYYMYKLSDVYHLYLFI